MRYWLTKQWPPLKGRPYAAPFDCEDYNPYVWLQRGERGLFVRHRERLRERDLVVVYEVKDGPFEVHTDGRSIPFRCREGCKGLIFHGSVISGFQKREPSREVEYVWQNRHPDREMMRWEWRAPIQIPSEVLPEVLRERHSIPCSEVTRALREAQEPMEFIPRIFGSGTGLGEITRTQYDALIKLFDAAFAK